MNNQKPKKYIQMHITLTEEERDAWLAHKIKKYNGLNAMSMMIRNYVNEGIARDNQQEK